MVPSIEIYDPRLESWIAGYPMNQPRGYSAAAVVEGSIHVIGGVKDDQDIVGTVRPFLLYSHTCIKYHMHINYQLIFPG